MRFNGESLGNAMRYGWSVEIASGPKKIGAHFGADLSTNSSRHKASRPALFLAACFYKR